MLTLEKMPVAAISDTPKTVSPSAVGRQIDPKTGLRYVPLDPWGIEWEDRDSTTVCSTYRTKKRAIADAEKYAAKWQCVARVYRRSNGEIVHSTGIEARNERIAKQLAAALQSAKPADDQTPATRNYNGLEWHHSDRAEPGEPSLWHGHADPGLARFIIVLRPGCHWALCERTGQDWRDVGTYPSATDAAQGAADLCNALMGVCPAEMVCSCGKTFSPEITGYDVCADCAPIDWSK